MVDETRPSSNNPAKLMAPAAGKAPAPGGPSAMAASAPGSADTAPPPSTVNQSSNDKSAHALPIPRWLLNAIGHVLAALLGLLLGLLILHWLRPDLLPWWPW
jgi:hypothetical protein